MSLSYSDSINFEQKAVSAPQYNLQKILQQSGGSSVSWSATSATTTTFDLPINVFNLAKSFLRYEILMTASGAAANFNACLLDNHPITRMSLQTRSGRFLADIPNFQHYWKVAVPASITNEEWAQKPSPSFDLNLQNARVNSLSMGCNPANASASVTPATQTFSGAGITSAAAVDLSLTARRPNTCIAHYTTAAAGNAGATAGLGAVFQLNFSDLVGTIFSMDKDLFSVESLQLVIEISNYDKLLFDHSAIGTLAGPATACVAGATPAFSTYALYLAIEQNEAVVQSIKNQVLSSGLKMIIPYSNVFRQNIGTATSGSVQQRINRGHGQRLLRIISAESLTTDTLTSTANYHNWNGGITVSFYTTIDSRQVEPETVNCQLGDDFRYMYRLIQNSPINNPQEYVSMAPLYVNDFAGIEDLASCKKGDLIARGKPLDQEVLFGRVLTSKSALNSTSTIIAVTQKEFISSKEGIDVV